MLPAVLAVDVGTSAAKAIVVSQAGEVLAEGRAAYPTTSPKPGWLEQNPEDWWQAMVGATRACLAGLRGAGELAAIGISGHMSALVALDRDYRPTRPAITIADTRCAAEAACLNERYRDRIAAATGNVALTAFTLPKLLWYRRFEPELFAQTRVVLAVKDYLVWRLTEVLGTEPTDAGNTLLLDRATRRWNRDLIDELSIPASILPPVRESLELVGGLSRGAAGAMGLAAGIPVIAGLADMGASTLGSGLLDHRRLAITLGTSGQITQVVAAPCPELLGKFTYHPHALPGLTYIMASLFTGGLGLQWFAETVADLTGDAVPTVIERVLERAAASPPGARGLLFLPYLTGRGSPEFDPSLTASLAGLTQGHTGSDLARAVLEGVGYSVRQCLEVMARHHAAPEEIVVGGGAMKSPLWRGIVADITGVELNPLEPLNAGPLGIALAAGSAAGIFTDLKERLPTLIRLAAPEHPNRATSTIYESGYRRFGALNGSD